MLQNNEMAIFSGGEIVKPLSYEMMRIKKIVQDREDCPKDEAVLSELSSGELVTILEAECQAPNPFHETEGYARVLHMDSGQVYYALKEKLQQI